MQVNAGWGYTVTESFRRGISKIYCGDNCHYICFFFLEVERTAILTRFEQSEKLETSNSLQIEKHRLRQIKGVYLFQIDQLTQIDLYLQQLCSRRGLLQKLLWKSPFMFSPNLSSNFRSGFFSRLLKLKEII